MRLTDEFRFEWGWEIGRGTKRGDKGGRESERWMGIREREEDEGERERETKKNCFSIKIIYYHLMKLGKKVSRVKNFTS